MDVPREAVTQLLGRMSRGDVDAADELLPLVEGELRAIAQSLMQDQGAGHTLQTTALVNEAWLRVGGAGASFEDRDHFLGVAARAMRSVLIDHARKKGAAKRGGGLRRVPLEELDALQVAFEERAADLLTLDDALTELAQVDPQLARFVELRFFGGLENAEVARLSDCSVRTVQRGWITARSWLACYLNEDGRRDG